MAIFWSCSFNFYKNIY